MSRQAFAVRTRHAVRRPCACIQLLKSGPCGVRHPAGSWSFPWYRLLRFPSAAEPPSWALQRSDRCPYRVSARRETRRRAADQPPAPWGAACFPGRPPAAGFCRKQPAAKEGRRQTARLPLLCYPHACPFRYPAYTNVSQTGRHFAGVCVAGTCIRFHAECANTKMHRRTMDEGYERRG